MTKKKVLEKYLFIFQKVKQPWHLHLTVNLSTSKITHDFSFYHVLLGVFNNPSFIVTWLKGEAAYSLYFFSSLL